MNNIKTYDTAEDFLAGRRDDLAVAINNVALNFNDNIPLNPTQLSESEMKRIVSRIPQYPFIVAKWAGVVNANGLNVVVNFDEDNVSDRTKTAKTQLKKKTFDLIYAKKNWGTVEGAVIEIIAREGMAIIRLNEDNNPVVDSRFRYNIYWNETQKKARYAYKDPKTGIEIEGLKNLMHGVEIFVIKHPSFISWPVPLSPVDTVLLTARLDFHAIIANQKKFDNGMIGQVFLQFNEEMDRRASTLAQGEDKDNWFMQMMRQLNDKFKGTKKSNQFSHLPGFMGATEVGNDNRGMQFYEIVKDLTPERIAWTWLMTTADFGTGTTSTYNNVQTFDDSLYDKVGSELEKQLGQALNEWLLPTQGIKTTPNYYVEYNKPKDHGKIEEIKSALEEWKNNAITQNEYRAIRGMDPIETGDLFISQLLSNQLPNIAEEEQRNNIIDAVVQPKRGYRETSFTEARNYRATTVDKALATEEFTGKKGFLTKLIKAIDKQLSEYAERLEGMEEVPASVEIKPLETFYSFPALKKDLLQFAGQALDEVRKDKRTEFSMKKEFFDGEYPKSVLDFIDDEVSRILKGDKVFESVDVETASKIETIIKNNVSESVFEIANKIRAVAESMSMNRAELIAQTEVANAVEGTREILYKSDPLFEKGGHKWLTSVNDVCPICKGNESQGIISIDKDFISGNSRPSAHPRCRCDTVYYTADEI